MALIDELEWQRRCHKNGIPFRWTIVINDPADNLKEIHFENSDLPCKWQIDELADELRKEYGFVYITVTNNWSGVGESWGFLTNEDKELYVASKGIVSTSDE